MLKVYNRNLKRIRFLLSFNYFIIEGILTYTPEYCPCCGIVNQSTKDIIKRKFRKIL